MTRHLRSRRAARLAAAALAVAFFLYAAVYYRKFRAPLSVDLSLDRGFFQNYDLRFGYFVAQHADAMQNQVQGPDLHLAPLVAKELLAAQNWERAYNVQDTSTTYRKSFSAFLDRADPTTGYGFCRGDLSVTTGQGETEGPHRFPQSMSTTKSRPDDGFFPVGARRRPPADPDLRLADEALGFGLDLLRQLYGRGDGAALNVGFRVVKMTYGSNRMYGPSMQVEDDLKRTRASRPERQSRIFALRAYRNYFTDGAYEVYVQAEPNGVDVSSELKPWLDPAAFHAYEQGPLPRPNCVDVTRDRGVRVVRAARCRARVNVRFVDGRVERVEEELTEEPLTVKTWRCSPRCRLQGGETVIEALSFTRRQPL